MEVAMEHPALKYFRRERLPHVWCAGCGTGQIFHYTVKAIEELGLDPDRVVWVSGIGCSGRIGAYWIGDNMHTLHGRPLAFATGIKLARPELKVIVHGGDGDLASIGGNHLIHAARRNVGLVTICINNFNYGMTGGQVSPTTPLGSITTTTPFGNDEPSFDLCELVASAGATYVARWTTFHARPAINSIKKALQRDGFSFIEIVSQCVTTYGRRNRLGDGPQMMRTFQRMSVTKEQAARMSEEELKGKIIVGEFVDRQRPEFSAMKMELIKRAGGGGLA
ncbi:MAG: 2-oxoacid:ferredoxin oxidoreductase subunit beta [Candidatus Bathyarchaeia archaeon]